MADKVLKRKMRKRVGGEGMKKVESIWMTDKIRKGIKERRKMSRNIRNCRTKEKTELWEKMIKHKKMVQKWIWDEKEKQEIKLTMEIRKQMRGGGKGSKVWDCINKLRGKEKKKDEQAKIYAEDGKIMGEKEGEYEVEKIFKNAYKTGQKNKTPIYSGNWKEGAKEKLEKKYENEKPGKVVLEGVVVYIGDIPMETPIMSDEDIKEELEDLEEGKAAGIDKMKPELYKELGKSKFCREIMKRNYNTVIKKGEIPKSWNTTRTTLIAKVKKTKAERSQTYSSGKYLIQNISTIHKKNGKTYIT